MNTPWNEPSGPAHSPHKYFICNPQTQTSENMNQKFGTKRFFSFLAGSFKLSDRKKKFFEVPDANVPKSGPTSEGAHYGNTDAEGNYVISEIPTETDWFFQSFCSAHLEQKHQWGEGIGVEDDMFVTNEEWILYEPGERFVGLSVS